MSTLKPRTQLNWLARYLPIESQLDAQARASLLEVGSGHRGLGTLLDTPFVGVEVEFAQAPEAPMTAVSYSGGRLPFAAQSFDTVVSLDVFEHVPPPQRAAFLTELQRVAARRVVIGFPADAHGVEADELMATVVKRLSMGEPGWLREHHRYGLPDSTQVEAQLAAAKGWRWKELPTTGSFACLMLTLVDVVPELAATLEPLLASQPDGVRRLVEAGGFGQSFRKVYLLERESPVTASCQPASAMSVMQAMRCPQCEGAMTLREPPVAMHCARCDVTHAREASGVWNLRGGPSGAAPAVFSLDPSWQGATEWVTTVHNYLHAFDAHEQSQLYLRVPAKLSSDDALALLAPVLAPFGEKPFPELCFLEPGEQAPAGALVVESMSTVTQLRARADGHSFRHSSRPTAAQRVQRARAAKKMHDEVKLAQARLSLQQRRALGPDLSNPNPLISVRINTFNRPELLVERAVKSVLAQTYQHFELVIVGDHAGPETAAALAKVGDERIRYENLPERPRYAKFPRFFWSTAGTWAVNRALDLCKGEWIAPLDDDDEFAPDHLEKLLDVAQRNQFEFVHSRSLVMENGQWVPLGAPPLRLGHVCHGSVMYSARLLGLRYDPWAWFEDEPGDWNMWKRMIAVGASIGFAPFVTGTHHPEYSAVVDPAEKQRLFQRVATDDEILADLEHTGAQHLLAMAGDDE